MTTKYTINFKTYLNLFDPEFLTNLSSGLLIGSCSVRLQITVLMNPLYR